MGNGPKTPKLRLRAGQRLKGRAPRKEPDPSMPPVPLSLPEEIESIRQLTTEAFISIANKLLSMQQDELRKLSKRKTTPAMEAMLAAVIVKGIAWGDQKRMDAVLNRVIGTVKQTIEHNPGMGWFVPENETVESLRARRLQAEEKLRAMNGEPARH